MILSIFDSPLISSILTPILTLAAIAALRYVQKQVTGAIDDTKGAVLKEVKAVDTKVDGVIKVQGLQQEEMRKIADGQHVDRERIARLEGRRDAQIEAAQLANAAATAVDVITHRVEEPRG